MVAGCKEGSVKTTVIWQDLGHPEQPGNYQFTDGMISVREDEIVVWQQHPNAMFTVVALSRRGATMGLAPTNCPLKTKNRGIRRPTASRRRNTGARLVRRDEAIAIVSEYTCVAGQRIWVHWGWLRAPAVPRAPVDDIVIPIDGPAGWNSH